jgi:predicted RNA-binding Zn ribbon-like protein
LKEVVVAPVNDRHVHRSTHLRDGEHQADRRIVDGRVGNAQRINIPTRERGEGYGRPDIAGVDGTLARLVGIVFTAMTDGTWARLKSCRNDRCQKAFYDTSKNRSGAWCSMAGCGSRLKARAYRHRRTAHLEERYV